MLFYFFIMFISILINLFFINFSHKFTNNHLIQSHDTHNNLTSRFGGISIVIPFTLYIYLTSQDDFMTIILLTFFALMPALIEDFRFNLNPFLRFIMIILSSFLIIISIDTLPKFDIPYIGNFLNNLYIQIVIYTISLACLVNGKNIIDGTNGLSSFTSLSIFLSILVIGHYTNNQLVIEQTTIIIITLICFLFFNFPLGKIFLGDSGCYFLGFISGYLIIDIFGKHDYLSTWLGAIILFYPVFEVIFSFTRKTLEKKSAFYPDNFHLHLKIYFFLKKKYGDISIINPLVTIILSPIWILPFILFIISLKINDFIFPSIFILILNYMLFYLFIYKINFLKKIKISRKNK